MKFDEVSLFSEAADVESHAASSIAASETALETTLVATFVATLKTTLATSLDTTLGSAALSRVRSDTVRYRRIPDVSGA
jgi:hypothetical protein